MKQPKNRKGGRKRMGKASKPFTYTTETPEAPERPPQIAGKIETVLVEIASPYDQTKVIYANLNTRESDYYAWFKRGGIDEGQLRVAELYRAYSEAVHGTGAASIDWRKPQNTSPNYNTCGNDSAFAVDARKKLKKAVERLGTTGRNRLNMLCVDCSKLSDIANLEGYVGDYGQKKFAHIMKDYLNVLMDAWRMVARGR
jgi:hypothetical protein